MTENLHRIVYYSRSRVEGGIDALRAAIDDILEVSRRNNAAVNITGALMFNAGCFGQVLEGQREVVDATFERIQRDVRHSEVSLLAFEPIAERSFGAWSMSFVGSRPEDKAAFGHIGRETGFNPAQADADALLTALRDLTIDDEGSKSGANPL